MWCVHVSNVLTAGRIQCQDNYVTKFWHLVSSVSECLLQYCKTVHNLWNNWKNPNIRTAVDRRTNNRNYLYCAMLAGYSEESWFLEPTKGHSHIGGHGLKNGLEIRDIKSKVHVYNRESKVTNHVWSKLSWVSRNCVQNDFLTHFLVTWIAYWLHGHVGPSARA